MAKTSWFVGGGTDSLGFTALAVGYAEINPFSYEGYQADATFWCTSTDSNGHNQALTIQQINGIPRSAYPPTASISPFESDYYCSVRFVKDN